MKKHKKHVRIGVIAEAVLGVVAVAGVVSVIAVLPGLPVAFGPFLKEKKYHPQQAVSASIDSLVKNGLLKRVKGADGSPALVLTRKGRWEAGIRGYLREGSMKKKWDGTWHIVIFDVPVNKRALRDELRRAVTLYGFVKLQQSVWVYPHPCNDFVDLVRRHLGVTNDVLYITANHIENDRWLRHEFKI